LDKQPKYVEPIILGERGKRRHGFCFFHISANIEMLLGSQDPSLIGGTVLSESWSYIKRDGRLSTG
jgi:hypothetical protein